MDDCTDPADSLTVPLELRDQELHLRRRADEQIRNALRIGVALLAGYKRHEIEERLGLTRSAYTVAHSWLRDAVRATRRE